MFHRRGRFPRGLLTALLGLALLPGCSGGGGGDDSCTVDAECGSGQVCDATTQSCVPDRTGESCATDTDCQPAFECVLGVCVREGTAADADADTDVDVDTDVDTDADSDTATETCDDGRLKCGGECCREGELCLYDECVLPGRNCSQNSQCPEGEYCDPSIGKCLPDDPDRTCEYVPPTGEFNPVVECEWTPDPAQVKPERNDVVMAPVVANLTDDNGDGETNRLDIPDIAFVTYDLEGDGCCNVTGTLRIMSGRCTGETTTTTHASIDVELDNSGGLAIGDLNGDGTPEIVAMLNDQEIGNKTRPQGVIAFRRTTDDGAAWSVYWRNNTYPTWDVHTRGGAQPSIADLDADGTPEVIVGNVALDGLSGALLWDGLDVTGGVGGIGNNAFLGPVSCVGDVDRDGLLEVAAGNTLYAWNGIPKWTYEFLVENSPCDGVLPCDGYTAMANFDGDVNGEVVIIRQGVVFILEHNGKLKHAIPIPVDDCENNEAGPPTIADFDGDGKPEIGTAAADYYVVVDPDCLGAGRPPECLDDGVLWATPNFDCSSRVTASSVFDFENDGQAEVVYADEQYFYILNGADGTELFRDETHGSHTRLELSVIADVDNDGNAEVVIAGNTENNGVPGVRTWGDAWDNWVRTRRIWNQHSYHITNITEDGAIPYPEQANWAFPEYNNFRQNIQGEGAFNAPDLTLDLYFETEECPAALTLAARVMNVGTLGVGPGVPVSFFLGTPAATENLLGTASTSEAILPGGATLVRFRWEVTDVGADRSFSARADDRGDGTGTQNECDEDNNEVSATIPDSEVCDCEDNDCDGEVDEGDLCAAPQACRKCECRDPCTMGECEGGLMCEDGYCVPAEEP